MGALLSGSEVDYALEAGREQLLVIVVRKANHLLDAGDPNAGQSELDSGSLGLYVDRGRGCKTACRHRFAKE
jgi:hypothetical protein